MFCEVKYFQKNSMLYNPRPRLRNVSEYFRDQANRQEVIFVNRETNEMFKVLLNQRQVSPLLNFFKNQAFFR